MKSKFSKNPELDDDDADIEAGGPSIAAAKKSKVTVIAASSILITVVIYFMFFKGADGPQENLVEVQAPRGASVTPSEEGKSPFEIDAPEREDMLALEKPAVPEIPTLPSLSGDSLLSDQVLPNELNESRVAAPLPVIVNGVPTIPMPLNQQQQQQPNLQSTNAAPIAQYDNLDPRYAPIIVFSGTAVGTPSRGVGYENNIVQLNQDPIDALEETVPGVSATYIKDRVHTIAQGKLLTAVLETAINTEIPGLVRGIVSRDVYGEAGNEVLIPRGSRLFGAYSSSISQGQGRVEIGWSRLIRPDGVDLAISFSASDQFGRSGISGDVDSKYGSIVAASMLTSILAVGAVAAAQKLLSDDDATTTTTNAEGSTTSTGSATNQAIYDVSKTITDTVGTVIGNRININPVIRVPQGTRVTVIVNSDIVIPSMNNR